MLLQNIGKYLPDYMTSHLRRQVIFDQLTDQSTDQPINQSINLKVIRLLTFWTISVVMFLNKTEDNG
jgi:hypothetical protein